MDALIFEARAEPVRRRMAQTKARLSDPFTQFMLGQFEARRIAVSSLFPRTPDSRPLSVRVWSKFIWYLWRKWKITLHQWIHRNCGDY